MKCFRIINIALTFFLLFASPSFSEEASTDLTGVNNQSITKQPDPQFDIAVAVRLKPPVTYCGENVPVDNPDVKERLETELLLMACDRAQTILWMKRAGRYFPYIEKMLKEKGLPNDLKYIAVIESSLRSGVNSNAGASGFWQFIESTGTRYGLDVNSFVDERRNLVESTNAALGYLSSLYSMFGSWSLAAAAYNMGEFGLKERIDGQDTRDYYNLLLPNETMRYVIRAVAVKMIFSDPARFGYSLAPGDLFRPVEAEQVKITCPGRISLMLVAKAAQTYYKTVRELNPELKGAFLDKGDYTLLIPKGSASGFMARFAANLNDNNLLHYYGVKKTHVVKDGETIKILAERFGIRPETLLKWNGLESGAETGPGKKIIYFSRI